MDCYFFCQYIKGEEFNIATRAVLGSGVFNADSRSRLH
jgi:hypothetical protein